ncbi:hypothetical protein ADUPG1_005803, partial [Aduncisulcus paluster]
MTFTSNLTYLDSKHILPPVNQDIQMKNFCMSLNPSFFLQTLQNVSGGKGQVVVEITPHRDLILKTPRSGMAASKKESLVIAPETIFKYLDV